MWDTLKWFGFSLSRVGYLEVVIPAVTGTVHRLRCASDKLGSLQWFRATSDVPGTKQWISVSKDNCLAMDVEKFGLVLYNCIKDYN